MGNISKAALALVLLSTTALAHEHKRPDLDQWFEKLRSGNGPCCSNMDGTALSDVDWETKDGHYRVRLHGRWVDVPEDAVITEPNRAGVTMVWPHWLNGEPMIRCFMPGSMT